MNKKILFLFLSLIMLFVFISNVGAYTKTYSISEHNFSLQTHARWSEALRTHYPNTHLPIGEGRNGYYWWTDKDFVTVGWCAEILCDEIRKNGLEIFDFDINNNNNKNCEFGVYTYTPSYAGWFNLANFNIFINDNFVGSFSSAQRNEKRITRIDFDCSVLHKGRNDIFVVDSDNTTYNKLTRIYWLSISYNTTDEIPKNLSAKPLILTSVPFFSNSIPTIFQYTNKSSQYVKNFIEKYNPDGIYTIGFASDDMDSVQIDLKDAPHFFFPNATEAVYYDGNATRGIFESEIASYLDIPVTSTQDNFSAIYNFSNSSIEDMQDFYIDKVVERGDDIDCIALVDPDHISSFIAGFYAGANNCFAVPVYESSYDYIRNLINETKRRLYSKGLFSGSSGYRMGKPLYVVIFGGNESRIHYFEFPDMGNEIIYDVDGSVIYNDMDYGGMSATDNMSLMDNYYNYVISRFRGTNEDTSLQIASRFLDMDNSSLIMSEYATNSHLDFLLYGGDILPGFVSAFYLGANGMNTTRLVEKRTDSIPSEDDIIEQVHKIRKYIGMIKNKGMKGLLGPVGVIVGVTELGDMLMYPFYEFDWITYIMDLLRLENTELSHLPLLNETNVMMLDNQKIAAYFGVGDNYWILPNHDMGYWKMFLFPYVDPSIPTRYVKSVNYSGILYNDHDISSESFITDDVIKSGGTIIASSGISHLVSNAYVSNAFFRSMSLGMTTGESFCNAVNMNPASVALMDTIANLYDPNKGLSSLFYIKSKKERVLYGDPKKTILPYKGRLLENPAYFVTPFFSFLSNQSLHSEYEIIGSNAVFNDTDTELVLKEMPIIPLYARDFYLPTGSIIDYVNFSGTYSDHEGIGMNIAYNDSYFTNYTRLIYGCLDALGFSVGDNLSKEDDKSISDCIKDLLTPDSMTYPYPPKDYWTENHTLLDGRVLLRVYVPAIIYDGSNSSRILEDASVMVDYDTDVEMSITSDDITIFDDAIVKAHVMNIGSFSREGNISVEIGSNKIDGNVEIPANDSVAEEFDFGKLGVGNYEALSEFLSDGIAIGPRYAHFSVYGFPFYNGMYDDNVTIDEGESGNVNMSFKRIVPVNLDSITIEATDFVSEDSIIRNGNVSIDVTGNDSDFDVTASIDVPDMQEPGSYAGSIDIIWKGHKLYSANISIDVPPRAVPEFSPKIWRPSGIPGSIVNGTISIKNTGNVPLEDISIEPSLWGIDDIEGIDPGETHEIMFTKTIPQSPPGTIEENITFLFDPEFTSIDSFIVPVETTILPVVFWNVNNDVWIINYTGITPQESFSMRNDNMSNMPIWSVDMSVENIDGIDAYTTVNFPVHPGEEKTALLVLNDSSGVENGTHTGAITVSGEDYFRPKSFAIPIIIDAKGPLVSIDRRLIPKTLYNLWGKVIVPQTAFMEIVIGNVGDEKINAFEFKDNIPDGWKLREFLDVYFAQKHGRKLIPKGRIAKKDMQNARSAEIRIDDIRSIIGRYVEKGDYIIIRYRMKATAKMPDADPEESTLKVYSDKNVYSNFNSMFSIPIKDIGNIFGFFR